MLKPFVENETRHAAFEIKKGPTVGYKDNRPNVLAAVTIEHDLDLNRVTRDLDNSIAYLLGTLGGFALMVWIIFYVIDMCFTSTKFKNYMASELYTVGADEP